jgi:Leucine-rich repeat (LRR) protein
MQRLIDAATIEIGRLSQLTQLNRLATLPLEIGNCPNLQLNLSGCEQLTTVQKRLTQLTQLTWLNLSGCGGRDTSRDRSTLTRLKPFQL